MFSRRIAYTARVTGTIAACTPTRAAADLAGKVSDKAADVMSDATDAAAKARASVADAASSATKHPIFSIGAGIATALAGYTVFCFTKDEGHADMRTGSTSFQARTAAQQQRSLELTKALGQRYSIVGHTDVQFQQPPRKITGADFESRKMGAALNMGELESTNHIWKGEYVDVSVRARTQPTLAPALPDGRGKMWHDDHMNLLVHEQEIHYPGTQDVLERTDRLEAESKPTPSWIGDRNSQFLQGFRLTSRESGNEQTNSAAAPGEVIRDIEPLTPHDKDSRIYAKKEDISKADNLGLDGGARASRDGQAMMDYAKRIASLP